MKRFISIFLSIIVVTLLLLSLGCKTDGTESANTSDSKTVLARTVTVDGTETPNIFAWYYHLQKDGTAMLDRFVAVSPTTEMRLPEKVDGHEVTALGRDTFRNESFGYGSDDVIVIPDSITTIEGNPFDMMNSYMMNSYFRISVSEQHPTLEIKNGLLFDRRDARLICVANAREWDGTIPDGTKIIEDHAFCGILVGPITIPASVERIGSNPFAYRMMEQWASEFTSITVDANNPYFEIRDGVLYEKQADRIICISRHDFFSQFTGGTSEYAIPDGTKAIDDQAFLYSGIRKVFIPASVREIGSFPFGNNVEVSVSPENPTFEITGGVLYDKVNRRVIGRESRTAAVTVPDGAEIICENALYYLQQDLVLPDSVREIASYGISGFGGGYENAPLLHLPKTVRQFGPYAIRGFRLENDSLILDGGAELGIFAFSQIMGLTDVVIGDGGAVLHTGAFSPNGPYTESSPLERFTVGTGETVIGKGTFYSCRHLTEVDLSEGVALIGSRAFAECGRLTELKLPKSLFYADLDAFLNVSYSEYYQPLDTYVKREECAMEFIVPHDSYAEKFVKDADMQYRFAD